jgi:hypothetical protein
MVAPVHFDPKILPKGSAKLRWVWQGQGTPYFIASVVRGKKKALNLGGPSSIDLAYFWGSNYKQRSCDGRGGGAQRPVWCGNELKKTGARSARARTRGQNPLVFS